MILSAVGVLACVCGSASAQTQSEARIVPVLEIQGYASGRPIYGLAEDSKRTLGQDQARFARYFKQVVVDAVQDLDLTLGLSERLSLRAEAVSPDTLVEWARSGWVIVPVMAEAGAKGYEVTLLVIPPGSDIVLSKSQTLQSGELEVRVMVMLRDLIRAGRRQLGENISDALTATNPTAGTATATQARSPGRAMLALTGAAVGGYAGFALQRASGSQDLRLTYPLAALGAGVGLGAAIVAADEWDVSIGNAWYLSAGAIWPNLATTFLADSYGAQVKDRYVWGLLGSGVGLALATTAAAHSPIREGGAVVVHSAAGFGAALGSLTEFFVEGRTDLFARKSRNSSLPKRGIGFGAAVGVAVGGAIATQVTASASRILMLDVGVGLGGLGAAAALSPLLIVEREENVTRNRLWLSGIALGMAAGGVVAYVATDDTKKSASSFQTWTPYAVPLLGTSHERGFTAGVQGSW